MNTIELKKSFHILIDSIDNENLLINFYDILKKRASAKESKLWKNLTIEDQKELLLALEESDNPENLIGHEEMKKKHQKWL
ncbi:MAG: hypothetical protein NTY07_12110 [Bacteroidia bacterium]|nr:hypothetical protein [Bacteroidia bacterium]